MPEIPTLLDCFAALAMTIENYLAFVKLFLGPWNPLSALIFIIQIRGAEK